MNTITISLKSYLTTSYKDEQHNPSSHKELTSNFLIVLLKLFKVFADLIFLGSFAHNLGPRQRRVVAERNTFNV